MDEKSEGLERRRSGGDDPQPIMQLRRESQNLGQGGAQPKKKNIKSKTFRARAPPS